MQPFVAPPPAAQPAALNDAHFTLKLCLRRFRPPRYAQVMLSGSQPVHLSAPIAKGRIAMAKGPWRTSGNWWATDAWDRDRWDVALESGTLFRLFQDLTSGRWFIEGSYD